MHTFDYKTSFEQSPALIIIIDTNFCITVVSDSYLKATDTKRENIMGQNIFNIFPNNPDDVTSDGEAIILASFNRVLKNKIPDIIPVIKYDIPKPANEGLGFTTKYWRACHSPVLDEFNNVKSIIQFVEDVTENTVLIAQLKKEKRILKQLEESEKRYNLLLMTSPFAFTIVKGKEMVVALINDSCKKVWNKNGQIEGRSLWEVLPELIDTPFPALLNEVYTTGIPFYGDELTISFQRADKMEDLYFNFIFQPYFEADETISGVAIFAYEVTAQVMLRNALAYQKEIETQALKRIEESNKRFYTMFMQSPFAFAVLKGSDLVITLANDLMKDFFGKGSDVEGKTVLEILPELIDQPFISIFQKVYTTGVPFYANEVLGKIQYDGILKQRYFNVAFQPDLNADQTISGVIAIVYEVTEMVLARIKVEQNETRYQTACAASNGFLWTSNASGEVEGVQNSWGNLSGQCLEEYQGNGWMDVIHPDDLIFTKNAWKAAINNKVQHSFEHRIRLSDSSWGLFLANAVPLFTREGSVQEWVVIHFNITAQRKAEEAVLENEKNLKKLVNSMPQKITTTDASGKSNYFNKQWIDETGLSVDELIEGAITKTIHPDDWKNTINNWLEAVSSGKTFVMEFRILNKNGEYRWNLSRAVPIKNEEEIITMWVSTNTDIHEQKEQKAYLEKAVIERTSELDNANKILVIKNEEEQNRSMDFFNLSNELNIQKQELSRANLLLIKQEEEVKTINNQLSQLNKNLEERVINRTKALAESENRFRSMMETIPQIAWTTYSDLEVNFYNKRWFEYTGLNLEQTESLGWQIVIHPDDLKYSLTQLTDILKKVDGGGFQIRLLSADNEYRWHLIRLMPHINEDDKIHLWIGTATDINELKLLQQQKDDFINIASHELKTPITSLKLFLQLLDEYKESLSPPIVATLITQANRSLDKFTVLIDDLLDASNANDGQLQLHKRSIILSHAMESCCNYVQLAGLYTLKFEGDGELKVYADAERIGQVMVNFINNATKYAPDSKEIRISIEKINGMVKVSVIDKGPGIAAEKLPRLFERYYQVKQKETDFTIGIGLGLYIAAEIIKRHRGQIGVESELGKGSTFWFTLPL